MVGLSATQRGTALRLGSLQPGALGGRLLRGGAKLLLCSSLFGRAPLLDRAIHRRAFFGRPSSFLSAALGRGTTLFLSSSFVFGAALRGRTLFGDPTLDRDALFIRAPFGCGLLDSGTFGGRLLLRRAALFFDAPLLGDAPFFGGAQLHRLAFRFDASRLFGEPYLFRVPRERGVVDGGEGLFVLEDREGLVVFALRGRLLRDVGCGRDGLVHCRPRFLDARRCS